MKKNKTGFTLIELLVVITILSILLGVSSGFFSHFEDRHILSSSTLHIYNMLRSAQQLSRGQNSSTSVKIYKEHSIAELWGSRLVGFWHCDDINITGSFGFHGASKNIQNTSGKINLSLQITPTTKIDFGNWQKFNISQGFILSCWIYPERNVSKEQILWQIGSYLSLELSSEGYLVLRTPIQLVKSEVLLPIYQWNYLEIQCDSNKRIYVYVNQFLAIEQSYPFPKLPKNANLTFGAGFCGRLDQVQLLSWNLLEEYSIPKSITIRQFPSEIRFNGKGYWQSNNSTLTPIILERIENRQKGNIEISPLGIIRYSILKL